MRISPRPRVALAILVFLAASSIVAPSSLAQYVYLDTNGDGVNTSADVVSPTGTTDLDVWIVTNAGRDGTPASCSSQDGDLTISGYEFILRATNGTLHWVSFTDRRPEFGAPLGEASSATDYRNGRTSGGVLPAGRYRLATVTVEVASGTPSVGFAANSALGGSFATSFASSCSGIDFDNTLKLGSDWFDTDGALYGGEANRAPQVGPVADMTVAEGALATQEIVADDADGNALTFQTATGPSFLSVATIDPGSGHATGRITLAPTFIDAGTYAASIEATDAITYSAAALFSITVTPTNRAPSMLQPPDITTTEGTPASSSLAAEDPDLDLLSFALVAGPAFVTVTTLERTPRGLGRIDAAPGYADAGDYTVTVSVSDGALTDTKSTAVHVIEAFDFKDPVLLSPTDMIVTAGETAEQTLHGRAPDGGDVVFSKVTGPTFLEVTTTGPGPDGTLGAIRVSPGAGDVGTYDASVSARGASTGTTSSFRIIVIAQGDPAPVGPSSFATPNTSLPVGNFPQDSALGDLDGDGIPDLVAINHLGGSLTLAFGRGDGSFPRRQTYDVGGRPISATIADLDRDGRNDIAFVDLDGNVLSVLHGVGASLFGHRSDYATGREPAFVAAADLSGDGIPDLVVPNEVDNTVSVFLGLSGGGFAPRVDYPVGRAPCQLSLGDVNHDGRPDVVVVNEFGNTLSVLLNAGLGALAPEAVYATGIQPRTVEIADLNLDGHPDLAVPNFSSDNFSEFLGRGDGTFGGHIDYPTGPIPWGLAVADLNRDGSPDVTVVETGNRRASIHFGDGTGRFGAPVHATVGNTPRTIRSGDLNRDGLVDFVVCNESGDNFTILQGNGDGTFGFSHPIGPPGLFIQPQAARIDDDEFDDIVAITGAGGLSVLYGDGRGGSAAAAVVPDGEGVGRVAIGDWNGDGRLDFAYTSYSAQSLTVLLNLGGRQFSVPTRYGVGAAPFALVSADWNGDGHADLALSASQAHEVLVYDGRGDGSFALAETKNLGADIRSIGAADWNGDGISDLAIGIGGLSQISIYLGASAGPLPLGPTVPLRLSPADIAFGDLDHDGIPEMLVAGDVESHGGIQGSLFVYHRGANAAPEPAFERDIGRYSFGIVVADLNGDGFPEVMVGDTWSVTLRIFQGSRNGVLGSGITVGPALGPPAVTDWDGDGAPDLIETDLEHLNVFRNRIPHTPPPLPARAFTTAENRVVRLRGGKPSTCAQLEPVAQSFAIQEVDPGSITMRSVGTGDVDEISAAIGKETALGDRDRNGVTELSACFPLESLSRLFSRLTGSSTVSVTLRGSLLTGRRFEAPLDLTVVAAGGPPRVTVAPNPMNPTATMTVVTEAVGPLRVRLFDASGRLVRTLVDARSSPAGAHALPVEAMPRGGPRLASGIYFYRVEAAGGTESGRIAIVK